MRNYLKSTLFCVVKVDFHLLTDNARVNLIFFLNFRYALDNLKFGKVDVGRFPEIAAEFHISDSAFSKQLPTLILFRDGSPVMYRPLVDNNGKLAKFIFNKENVIIAFDLNNLHLESKKLLAEKEKSKKASAAGNAKHPKTD